MKKLLFSFVATIMLGLVGNAQMTLNSRDTALNSQLVTLVSVSKNFYSKGQTYENFIAALTLPSPTYPSQEKFYRKLFFYVSNDFATCDIMKADTSEFIIYLQDCGKRFPVSEKAVPGPKKWWQILINLVVNIGLDIYLPSNIIDVDLFPNP